MGLILLNKEGGFDRGKKKMTNDLTSGSVLKNMLRFSLPYLLSFFLQTLYGMADLFIIGQFDEVAATTAVSVGSQIMHMLTVMIVGLAMGATVTIGRYVGAKDGKSVSKSIGNTVTLFIGLSLVLTVILLICNGGIVSVMQTPAEAVDGTKAYLTVCFIGIPFITAYNIISSIFRGLGDSKSPMYFIAVACAANIGLDYLFIGAFSLGPVGAALGTTVSQAISVVISLVFILKKKTEFSLEKEDFRLKKKNTGEILKIGIPVCFQDGFIQISFIIITVIANLRGLTDAAAVGIVEKIIGFVFLVPSSLLSTVSAFGAQNIGANLCDRAKLSLKYAIIIATGFGLCMSVLVQFIAEPLVGLFTPDAAVAAAGGPYLRGYIFDCLLAGIHFSFSGYFCACGKSGLSFLHNVIAIVAARVPGAYLMSKMFPETLFPMGLATAAGSLVSVVVCVVAYFVCCRKKETANG